jgi:nicotinamide-nucleotide amidase
VLIGRPRSRHHRGGGPEPDEDGNPVGLVHLAAACRDGRISHIERRFGEGSRAKNRALALDAALGLLEVMIRGTQGAEIDKPHTCNIRS